MTYYFISDPKHGFLHENGVDWITLKMCYQNDINFAIVIRMFMSLKWVPVDQVREYFKILVQSEQFKEYRDVLREFKNYFRVSS